ncbi:YbaB/EbfC family nucleoid-associated protein [Allokutzneria sp. A3M-2-11 16]|uniref:YbaB/EbfC family nucleoid-associated protein n=1 Tax=Allokutzneria sp. A3M-2-11 16 TaxID=2962043 RepID=UPI0020B654BD|nr:YbaB/EbfC family nucleoid-associated protein [Allokutzneria sp. A3M-2-11 16]MCP3799108.1 YbaB/EbfC family nucleoid-associated protein [Allokutzneria sp. A3M-2-11 16]
MNHQERVQRMLRSFEERVQQISQAQDKLRELQGTARSGDGAITVTVSPAGAVLDLRLSPDAMKRSHTALQQDILKTIRLATANAAQRMDTELEPILGEHLTEAKQAMNGTAG